MKAKNILLILSFLVSFLSNAQTQEPLDSTISSIAIDINNVSFEIEINNFKKLMLIKREIITKQN